MSDLLLGHSVVYPVEYAPELLFPVARAAQRSSLGLQGTVPFYGNDVWNAYEISWLSLKGKPQVALGRFTFPCTTANIIESKSLKLYLNSLNQSRFASIKDVAACLEKDLSRAAGAPVEIELSAFSQHVGEPLGDLNGFCLDDLDIEASEYQYRADLLVPQAYGKRVDETLVSHLLRSNCPVTGQPDWGSVQISYEGPAVDKEALLRYLIAFRLHQEFHEHCIERIYVDFWERLQPSRLAVVGCYTRRGGLDINPWRASTDATPILTPRLVRQ